MKLLFGSLTVVALCAANTSVLAVDSERLSKVTVYVTNVRSKDGFVRAGLCTEADRYPGCPRTVSAPAVKGTTKLVFSVKPGTYAFYGIHDENGNDRIDFVQGLPSEGFAFGNDAVSQTGAPTFKSASTEVRGNVVLRVKMAYLERPTEAKK